MLDDLKFAIRRLRHAPGFAIVAVLTLAVAVGANTAILSIADGVLFRPLPYRDADQLFVLQIFSRKTGGHYTNVSHQFVNAIAEQAQSVGDVGYFTRGPRVTVETLDGTEIVPSLAVSAGYFAVVGVTPARGRVLGPGDTIGRSAVLSYSGWRKRFAGDPAVVGRAVTLGSTAFDVVGVLPQGFLFPASPSFAGNPEVVTLAAPIPRDSTAGTFHPVVRLEPGVTRERAQSEMDAVVAPVIAAQPRLQDQTPFLENVREIMYPVGRPIMRFLLTAAALVLLVGCANLANMLLARGRRYERETAVRTALGASRARLIRPLIFEALIIGLAASSAALLVTAIGFDALRRAVPAAAFGYAPVGVDMRIVIFALALGLLGGLIFAIVPAWRSARLDVLALIQGRHRTLRGHAQVGRPMVAVQVALAIVLVFGAAVAARAFVSVLGQPLGFSTDRVVRLTVVPPPGTQDPLAFYRRVVEALAARPDVVAAGASGAPPLGGMVGWSSVLPPDSKTPIAGIVHVLPGYFETLDIRPTAGRLLTWDDAPGMSAVVSESAARVLFPGTSPLGQAVTDTVGDKWQVIGVVPDVRAAYRAESPPVYVVPRGRAALPIFFARMRTGGATLPADLRRYLAPVAAGAPVAAAWWIDVIGALTEYQNPRFQTIVLTTFAAIALGLTALGIFGVVAFLVASRYREMGIRVAVGAAPGALVRLVVRQALLPVAAGLVVGLVATRWAAKLAEAQLFQVDTRDPWTLALTASAVVLAAMAAAYLPARRAARVDPIIVLRAE